MEIFPRNGTAELLWQKGENDIIILRSVCIIDIYPLYYIVTIFHYKKPKWRIGRKGVKHEKNGGDRPSGFCKDKTGEHFLRG